MLVVGGASILIVSGGAVYPVGPEALRSVLGVFLGIGGLLVFACKDAVGGRSPGKWIFGLQVVDAQTREPIGWKQSLKRNLLAVIFFLVPYVGILVLIIICITMMEGRHWGDKWAKTEIVWLKHATRPPFAPDNRYCRVCGYDLTGNVSGRCPECGTEIPRPGLVPCAH